MLILVLNVKCSTAFLVSAETALDWWGDNMCCGCVLGVLNLALNDGVTTCGVDLALNSLSAHLLYCDIFVPCFRRWNRPESGNQRH